MNKHPNHEDCLNDDDCTYQEPHLHGFACDKQCACRNGGHESASVEELLPLSRIQRFKNIFWRWRATRAFDARDQYGVNTPDWLEANKKVERLFKIGQS